MRAHGPVASAGKLRDGPPNRATKAGTRAWAVAGHFLIVDVEAMTIPPETDGGKTLVSPTDHVGSANVLVSQERSGTSSVS